MRKERGRTLAKDMYKGKIIRQAIANGGAIKLEEVAKLIGTGKTYAWKLLQELVENGRLTRGGYGLYLLKNRVQIAENPPEKT